MKVEFIMWLKFLTEKINKDKKKDQHSRQKMKMSKNLHNVCKIQEIMWKILKPNTKR